MITFSPFLFLRYVAGFTRWCKSDDALMLSANVLCQSVVSNVLKETVCGFLSNAICNSLTPLYIGIGFTGLFEVPWMAHWPEQHNCGLKSIFFFSLPSSNSCPLYFNQKSQSSTKFLSFILYPFPQALINVCHTTNQTNCHCHSLCSFLVCNCTAIMCISFTL